MTMSLFRYKSRPFQHNDSDSDEPISFEEFDSKPNKRRRKDTSNRHVKTNKGHPSSSVLDSEKISPVFEKSEDIDFINLLSDDEKETFIDERMKIKSLDRKNDSVTLIHDDVIDSANDLLLSIKTRSKDLRNFSCPIVEKESVVIEDNNLEEELNPIADVTFTIRCRVEGTCEHKLPVRNDSTIFQVRKKLCCIWIVCFVSHVLSSHCTDKRQVEPTHRTVLFNANPCRWFNS